MAHDFVKFPELTNTQAETEYWNSPHKQIFEDFTATVTKVKDGDTLQVQWNERDFEFPVRLLAIDTKELSEGGSEAKEWLSGQILEEEVLIQINKKNRVGKYGRILGRIIHKGIDMNEALIRQGLATTFGDRNEGKFPNIEKELNMKQWLTL